MATIMTDRFDNYSLEEKVLDKKDLYRNIYSSDSIEWNHNFMIKDQLWEIIVSLTVENNIPKVETIMRKI